jgi:hypothetical protein
MAYILEVVLYDSVLYIAPMLIIYLMRCAHVLVCIEHHLSP